MITTKITITIPQLSCVIGEIQFTDLKSRRSRTLHFMILTGPARISNECIIWKSKERDERHMDALYWYESEEDGGAFSCEIIGGRDGNLSRALLKLVATEVSRILQSVTVTFDGQSISKIITEEKQRMQNLLEWAIKQ